MARTVEVIAGGLVVARLAASDLAALGVTNQRETIVVWNPRTGPPWYNAVVWQDARTASAVDGLALAGVEPDGRRARRAPRHRRHQRQPHPADA